MKRSTLLFLGILLGILIVPGRSHALSFAVPDEDPAGVEDASMVIKVFPNPSDGRFQLSFDYSEDEKIVAKVYDITGKLVKDISNDLVKDENSVSANIDLENPGSGIYFIRIEWGRTILTKKIIIR